MKKVPNFEIISANGPIPDDMIVDRKGFYTHMMNFVVNALLHENFSAIYDGPTSDILCRFIDENNNTYTSRLEHDGYKMSLSRCLNYFEETENFERCTIIKKLLKNL